MKIMIDTREQFPFRFERYSCETIRGALTAGDYSIPGHEARCSIERKNGIDELVSCLSHDRDRFERELQRAKVFSLFAVVIEGRFEDLAAGRYRSRMTSKAALASVCAFHVRFGVPFLFAGNRAAAESLTFELLSKYLRESQAAGSLTLR